MAEVPAATRIVIATDGNGGHDGFGVDDVAWLLRNAQGEVLVVRPDPRAHRSPRCCPSATRCCAPAPPRDRA